MSLELHICGHCRSALVYPLEWWYEEDAGLWYVMLRCPECECRTSGLYPQPVVDRFDDVLERGTDELMAGLKQLVIENTQAALDAERGLRERPRS